MKVQCEYCNSWIDDTDEKCPNCGGVNKAYKRATDQTPKTIEELKQWYVNHHLPPEETTRLFIGRNYQQPRAFGIYQNEKGEFIVYKNKDNGQRAIRYQGTDEAYAVNELYMKLKEEILNQKRNSKQPVQYPSAGSTFKRPEGHFAGKLIEDARLKGVTVGGAQVSTLHSGFIINRGGATATDILQLISLVQNTVYDRFGVMLEPEVRIIG